MNGDSIILKIISVFIIIFVLVSVFGSTFLILKKGVMDDNSNFKIAERWISAHSSNKILGLAAVITTNMDGHSPAIDTVLPVNCMQNFYDLALSYDGSLVNYLSSKNEKNSFDDRKSLAENLNIPGYTGTYSQNQVALARLFVEKEGLFCPTNSLANK